MFRWEKKKSCCSEVSAPMFSDSTLEEVEKNKLFYNDILSASLTPWEARTHQAEKCRFYVAAAQLLER